MTPALHQQDDDMYGYSRIMHQRTNGELITYLTTGEIPEDREPDRARQAAPAREALAMARHAGTPAPAE